TADDPDALIFYTTDGSDPKDNGKLYTGAISVTSRVGEANEYVSIPNRFGYGYSDFLKSYAYQYAPEPVDKATTITVRLYKDGHWAEEMTAATYWVDVEQHTLPVVSVTADAQELFGPEGIYTPGATYYTMLQQGNLGKNANFMSGESIDARVQILNSETRQSLETQISIAGQNSRLWFPMKNLSVDLQQKNETLSQALYEDDLDGFSLKGTGNGGWQYFYLDGFWNNYLYGGSLGAQYNIPVVLYLEDEYWGIYCIRNKKNAEFIAQQYDVDPDSVVICTSTEPDEEDSIHTLDAILRELPCDESGWAWINEHFDVESYIDYVIPNLYANNWDGLRTASNTILWKATEGASEEYSDGRWRFLLNDLDMTVVYGFMDPIADLVYNTAETYNMQQVLFQKLWEYEEFRTMFAERFRTEMETTYAPENILPAFEAWCEQLEPEMPRNITRQKVETTWLAPLADWLTETESDVENMTMEQWQADYQSICEYLSQRADDLLEFLEADLAEAENG
ncbi:CotH kinase family protein, partial [uncultured Subdoligranulum sp.]|uniref:CotH kinase family protein n=1 Tax=uncultured Subdoligranulum sp. TaxID=512298 RepID=UPI002630C51C